MIDPNGELLAIAQQCLAPLLALMLGALVLGTAIGLVSAPGTSRAMERLRMDLKEAGERLELAGTIQAQRLEQHDREAATERLALEQEIASLNEKVGSLRMALTAAKRPAVAANAMDAQRLAELEKQAARVPELIARLEAEKRSHAQPAKKATAKKIDKFAPLPEQVYKVMSTSFGRRIEPDDLTLVEGIGPKIAGQLKKHGLGTWADVAAAKPAQLKKLLAEAGDRFHLHDPSTWPEQCRMMAQNRWDELRKYQRKLNHGR